MILPSSSMELLCTAGTIVIDSPERSQRPARVHAGDVLQPLLLQPHATASYGATTCAPLDRANRHRIAGVIAVAVRDQHQIELRRSSSPTLDCVGLPVTHGSNEDPLAAGRLNRNVAWPSQVNDRAAAMSTSGNR